MNQTSEEQQQKRRYFSRYGGTDKHGFTLVELSVTLVIISLLIAGIVTGREMIRISQIRSVASDIGRFSTAISAFRGKYNCIPGDCATATQFWGRADGNPDTSQNCASPDTDIDTSNSLATCNGNGNGIIADGTTTQKNTEGFRLWQHLGNAGLLSGSYTGIGSGAPDVSTNWRGALVGTNVPASRLGQKTGYSLVYQALNSFCGGGSAFTSGAGITISQMLLYLGAQYTPTSGLTGSAALTTDDAMSIDTKIDDGAPGTGKVYATCATTCTTTQNTATSMYRVGVSGSNCRMHFVLLQ